MSGDYTECRSWLLVGVYINESTDSASKKYKLLVFSILHISNFRHTEHYYIVCCIFQRKI